MTFTVESLSEQLAGYPPGSRFAVACSGGLDSIVLLHAAHAALRDREPGTLRAIHVHHGLSPNANAWESHCHRVCKALGIPLHVEYLHVNRDEASSLENIARQRRYEAFESVLEWHECLLMAHHLDDQAETFLMRTLRGAGPRGLAAIPVTRVLGRGHLLRPLLHVTRASLEAWAQSQGLAWVDDESNASLQHDRNYCRHSVLPLLEARWPQYRQSWMRTAQLSEEADELMEALAQIDFETVKTGSPGVLDTACLQNLSSARQRNVLRYWLQIAGAPDPGWNVLVHIVDEMLAASEQAHPELRWREGTLSVVIRRHKGCLYLQKVMQSIATSSQFAWSPLETLHLPSNGCVYALAMEGQGLRIPDGAQVSLRYRQGGEVCRLAGRRSRPLKKILQDANIPPWLRERMPLVYIENELVCIPGIGVCEGWRAEHGASGWKVIWMPPDVDPDA